LSNFLKEDKKIFLHTGSVEKIAFRCRSICIKSSTGGFKLHYFQCLWCRSAIYFRPVSKVFITAFPFFNRANIEYTRLNVRIVAKRCELNHPAKHSFGPHLQAFLAAQSAEGFISQKKVLRFGKLF